jgi:hypothetical protein
MNPALGEFEVLTVEFEDGTTRSFASGLEAHKLNHPEDLATEEPMLNPAVVLNDYGAELEKTLTESLAKDSSLVKIAGRWFPRALLVDVNLGHLNLAEAVLDEAGGKPLSASSLIEQVELPGNVNPKLVEFSMNFALQEDGRFDEVGPAGEVLWCLKRLEPEDVQQIPQPLRYMDIPYDRSILTDQMKALELELDDELVEGDPVQGSDEVTVSLSYPHWRAGTLPVSRRLRGLFPSAYESPRVRFILVDGQSKEEMPAWFVRQHGYIAGLGRFYQKYGMMPGSLVTIARGRVPGQALITARVRRPTKDWVRTVLVGSDGGIVFATLKQNLTTELNERMAIAVPDLSGVDEACARVAKEHLPLEKLVADMMKELVKLNVQGHVHAQELYSALNILRRCPPGPLLAFLTGNSNYKHVGDLHYRFAETEAQDE